MHGLLTQSLQQSHRRSQQHFRASVSDLEKDEEDERDEERNEGGGVDGDLERRCCFSLVVVVESDLVGLQCSFDTVGHHKHRGR